MEAIGVTDIYPNYPGTLGVNQACPRPPRLSACPGTHTLDDFTLVNLTPNYAFEVHLCCCVYLLLLLLSLPFYDCLHSFIHPMWVPGSFPGWSYEGQCCREYSSICFLALGSNCQLVGKALF